MDFRNAKARQPEIVRSVQKDSTYTNALAEDLSDVLRLTGPRNWIKYNQLCKLIGQITYHGFASFYNMQTLGEEYTGVIQVKSDYRQIPSRMLQLISIILEFGGEPLFLKVLQKLDKYVKDHDEIVPEAKEKLRNTLRLLRHSPGYIKALHKSLFYLRADSYQISKRFTGINYVLIRHWLQPEFSLYGYKILGIITFLQVSMSVAIASFEAWRECKRKQYPSRSKTSPGRFVQQQQSQDSSAPSAPQCVLCLEPRSHISVTPCGHLFCWDCILEWLDERDDCPLCREFVKKSSVIQLQNYL